MKLSDNLSKVFSSRNMGGSLPFNLKALMSRAIICLSRKIYHNARGYGAYSLASRDEALDFDATIDWLQDNILAGKPFMAGKIGTTDGEALSRYIDRYAHENRVLKWLKILTGLRGPYWWDNSIRAGICVCAGVFPISDDAIEDFCRIFMSYCNEFDGFASWVYGESRLRDLLCPQSTPIELEAIVPLSTPHTWYGALHGKKVLVVHQYIKTIRAQYDKRVEFHKGQGPLPEFELMQYRPVNSAGGKCDEYQSWAAALQHMVDDISQFDFDVALLGCGVYGIPLAAHIKRMGKIAIYTGGATQAIFGIKGGRWDTYGIYNEHWIRPFPDDIPRDMDLIEGGSFV